MAKQTINIGTTANDGTGDPIRAAFGKVNDNFTEIYTANTGVNTGDQNLSAYATTAVVAAGYQPLDSDLTAISALTTTAYGRALLSTADATTLRSAIGVGTTDAPTFLAQSLTGQTLTDSQATNLLNLSTTWNTVGSPSLIYGRVTNTNSSPTANLIDLGTFAGGTLFKVTKSGALNASGYVATSAGGISLSGGGLWQLTAGHLTLKDVAILGWSGGSDVNVDQPGDLRLYRDAPGILAQRNGTSAQAFRVYDTYDTAGTNYERGTFGFPTGTNTLRIGTEQAGTGAAQPIDFVTGGVVRMSIAAAGNLGVGIYAPVAKLDVLFPTSSTGLNLASNAATSVSNFLTWSTAWGLLSGGIKSSDVGGGWNTQIYSSSKISLSAGGVDSPDLTIDSTGNVGIGTTTPASKLQVTSGDIEVETVTNGIILKAAGTSTRYRLTLNAGGTALVFTAV